MRKKFYIFTLCFVILYFFPTEAFIMRKGCIDCIHNNNVSNSIAHNVGISIIQNSQRTPNCTCGVKRRNRIINGVTASIREFPWLAKINLVGVLHCVGAMITKKHLFTAGHCLRYGSGHIEIMLANKKRYEVLSIKMHENFSYEDSFVQHDIVIVELDKEVKLGKRIRTICLPDLLTNADFADKIGIAAGWGFINEDGPVSELLQKVSLPILSKQKCSESKYKKSIMDDMFCAGYLTGKYDTCKGDSGGPLMVRGPKREMIAAGIISNGKGCGRPGYPGIYMNLSHYVDWIKEHIDGEQLCPPP